jgi:hypothetical protein
MIYDIEQTCDPAILASSNRWSSSPSCVLARTPTESPSAWKSRSGAGGAAPTLDRLEAKGLIHSWFADPTPQRGGRSKRYFQLLPKGVQALSESRDMFNRMWQGVSLKGEPDA